MRVLLLLLAACGPAEEAAPEAEAWTWDLPDHFPEPVVPADNPMTEEKVLLGRHLFYDARLSVTGEVSCASCHDQALAFTDGEAVSTGATGDHTPRSAMSLANVAYASRLTWANPLIDTLEGQALIPMLGELPVEMGLAGIEDQVLAALADDPATAARFADAFPDQDAPVTLDNVTKAIASFERTLLSTDSPYDRYVAGDSQAMTDSQKRGFVLFMSERLECFHCHGGFDFTDSMDHSGLPEEEVAFHNTGLYDLDGAGAYPEPNRGVYEITGDPDDMGRFKAPSLRNVAVTAPYMHDGSIATLGEVIDTYAYGGRTDSPLKSSFLGGFILSETEREDLLAFFDALTDDTFLTDPRYAAP